MVKTAAIKTKETKKSNKKKFYLNPTVARMELHRVSVYDVTVVDQRPLPRELAAGGGDVIRRDVTDDARGRA